MTILDPDFGSHESRRQPEIDLILAVLGRAVLDLFGSVAQLSTPEEGRTVRQDALLFLTRETGPWAKRRTELCDSVGIDGNDMRKRVIKVLEGEINALAVYDERQLLTHIEAARKLWFEEKRKPMLAAAARKQQAKVVQMKREKALNKIRAKEEIRETILSLLDARPMKFKDLMLAVDGMSDSVARIVLKKEIERGTVEQNPKSWKYSLTPPQTALAANCG